MRGVARWLVLLFVGACRGQADTGAAVGETSAAVEVAKVSKGDIEQTISTYGTVEFAADRQRTLAFVRSGQVISVAVVAGQMVKKGDVLLSLGGVPANSPEVQHANIQVEFATRELVRVRRLIDEKLATNQELQQAEQQLAAAETALRALGGGTAGGTPLQAPTDGIVAQVLVQPGTPVQPGQPGVVIASRDAMAVHAGFEVEDLPALHGGQTVRLSPVFVERSASQVEAKLSMLHRVVNPKTQLVEGVIQVTEPAAWMAAGLAVRVIVVIESHPNVLRLPRSALLGLAGKQGVFVVDDRRVHFHPLTLGIADADMQEVTDGLQDGASVVTTGRSSVSDGMPVRITNPSTP
jgi:RND family efflux transporter MFP subunit